MPAEEQADEPIPDQTRPIPPRYWWLKRILLAAGVLILALAALRWWWGWEAERRLEAKIAEYRAAGQPVTVDDFQFPPIPDDENAAYFLAKAAGAIVAPPGCSIDTEYLDYDPEFVAEHLEEVGELIEANAEVLRLAREARLKPRTDWGMRLTSPVMNVLFPGLAPQRRLARFLRSVALYQHYHGKDVEAVELARDVLGAGERLSDMGGGLISHIVALAVSDLAVYTLEDITPALDVEGPGRPTTTRAQCVSRQQVEALIEQLLDDEAYRRHWRTAIYVERLQYLDLAELVATAQSALVGLGTPGPVANRIAFYFGPAYRLDAVRMAKSVTPIADAREEPDWPSATMHVPLYRDVPGGVRQVAHPMHPFFWGPALCERPLRLSYHTLALRRMAATGLAIRLYELDQGQRPGSLGDLVPEYLAAVPADPFADDGRPLGYRADDLQLRLYSIGPNGVDQSGEYALTQRGEVDWDQLDIPYFLDADRPRPHRETYEAPDMFLEEAVDHDQDIGDGEGHNNQQQASDNSPLNKDADR